MQTEIEEYLAWKATYAESAYRSYKSPLKSFSKFIDKNPRQVTLAEIVAFANLVKRNYSPQYATYIMTVVRNLVSYLNDTGPCSISPRVIKAGRVPYSRRVVVTEDDFGKMIKVCREDTFTALRDKLIISLLWDTGVRVSELCAITIDDIDIQERLCTVPTRKARGERYITWSTDTQNILIKYLGVRLCINNRPELLISYANRSKVKQAVDTRTVQRVIKKVNDDAGITKNITPHSFRHGKAHKMLSMGANVKEIQATLGHSENNPTASFRYLRLEQGELRKIIKKYV